MNWGPAFPARQIAEPMGSVNTPAPENARCVINDLERTTGAEPGTTLGIC